MNYDFYDQQPEYREIPPDPRGQRRAPVPEKYIGNGKRIGGFVTSLVMMVLSVACFLYVIVFCVMGSALAIPEIVADDELIRALGPMLTELAEAWNCSPSAALGLLLLLTAAIMGFVVLVMAIVGIPFAVSGIHSEIKGFRIACGIFLGILIAIAVAVLICSIIALRSYFTYIPKR